MRLKCMSYVQYNEMCGGASIKNKSTKPHDFQVYLRIFYFFNHFFYYHTINI